jgi:uncharacterized protein YnzC (UPF0291/DUF896 family)
MHALLASQQKNVAVLTGRWSRKSERYLVVIDVDRSDHPILSEMPKTFGYRTGKMGHHLWYWSKFPLKNSVSKLAANVDVRGQDGYVVIPPSRHISGIKYHFEDLDFSGSRENSDSRDKAQESFREIAELPEFLLERLRYVENQKKQQQVRASKKSFSHGKTKIKETNSEKTSLKSDVSGETLQKWTSCSVADIRRFILSEKIPYGVRNTVIHRLLSSDRARGASESELYSQSRKYVACCEALADKPITKFEIKAIISQVLKYNSYNTSYAKVNQEYFAYMARSKKQQELGEEEKQNILRVDQEFFSSLRLSLDNQFVSLELVAKNRENFFTARGLSRYSKYPPPLLAKKLESLGFSRKRTNKGNVWNVSLDHLFESDVKQNSKQNSMTTQSPDAKNLDVQSSNLTQESKVHSSLGHSSPNNISFEYAMENICLNRPTNYAKIVFEENQKFSSHITTKPLSKANMSTIHQNNIPNSGAIQQPTSGNSAINSATSSVGVPANTTSGSYNANQNVIQNVKITINKHPSEYRYSGKVNRESSDSVMKYLYLLSEDERHEFLNGTYVHDEEATAAEFDAVQPGDLVGVLLQYDDEGWVPSIFEVSKIENDILYVEEVLEMAKGEIKKGSATEITFEEVSRALSLGYFEILYRPDPANPKKLVPFGIEREKYVNIRIPSSDPIGGNSVTSTSGVPTSDEGSNDETDDNEEPDAAVSSLNSSAD